MAPRPRRRAQPKRKAKKQALKTERQDARRAAVKALNVIAAELGVATLPVHTVGQKVQKLIKRLQACRITEDTANRLREAAAQWQSTGGYLDGVVVPAAGAEVASAEESCTEEPQGDPVVSRHKVLIVGYRLRSRAFMLTYNSRSFTKHTWHLFRQFCQETARRMGAAAWAACFEESLHAAPPSGPASSSDGRNVYHGHAYYMWEDGEGVSLRNTDDFVFQEVRPRVDTCTPTNSFAFRQAALHGLWYVTVSKRGTVAAAANREPWRDYTPAAPWLVSLWNAHKVTHDQFEMLSAQFRSGHAARMKDLAAVLRTERAAAVRAHVEREMRGLEAAPALLEPRTFDEVELFFSYFTRAARRRPMLVIVGATGILRRQRRRRCRRRALAVAAAGAAAPPQCFPTIFYESPRHWEVRARPAHSPAAHWGAPRPARLP